MKICIRANVFETNSSSTHSYTFSNRLVMCTKEEKEQWVAGKLLYDMENRKLVLPNDVENEYKELAIEVYHNLCKDDKFRTPWDNLSLDLQSAWIADYFRNYVKDKYWTYDYFKNVISNDITTAEFVASNGEIIVAISGCYYDEYDEYD